MDSGASSLKPCRKKTTSLPHLCVKLIVVELMSYCFLHIYVCVGGEGKVGKVVDIRGWDTESGRSVASVTWSNGTTNVYRMGHKGKVDLKYVSDGQGGFYYKDHLPKLGKPGRFLVLVFTPYKHVFVVSECKIRRERTCSTFGYLVYFPLHLGSKPHSRKKL